MHGPKSLPEYGNKATATLKVPASTVVPEHVEYSYAGRTLHFACELHKDQQGPSRTPQDSKTARGSHREFTTAAARDRGRDAVAQASGEEEKSATPLTPQAGTAPSPSAGHTAVSLAVDAPATTSACRPLSSSSLSSSSSSSSSPPLHLSSTPASGSSEALVSASPDAGTPSAKPTVPTAVVAAPALDDEGYTKVQHKDGRKRALSQMSPSSKVICLIHRPVAPPSSPSSDSTPAKHSHHNSFDALAEEEADIIDYEGVEGGEEIPVTPDSSPGRGPPLKRANKKATPPPNTLTPIKERDFMSDRAARGGSPTSRADWLSKTTTLTTSPSLPEAGRRPVAPQ